MLWAFDPWGGPGGVPPRGDFLAGGDFPASHDFLRTDQGAVQTTPALRATPP
jgi:hypothetical protein